MGVLSEHFSAVEFQCHDCGQLGPVVETGLVAALEKLRALGPEPITIDDAYRCPENNTEAGGVSDSQHLLGKAADIVIHGLTLQQMYDRAVQVPEFLNGGIGVYDTNPTLYSGW